MKLTFVAPYIVLSPIPVPPYSCTSVPSGIVLSQEILAHSVNPCMHLSGMSLSLDLTALTGIAGCVKDVEAGGLIVECESH